MVEEIEYIDKNTRKRKINGEWKLEKLDPIHGVWVIHPIQFWKDFNMEETFREMEQEQEQERKDMFKPEKAKHLVERAIEWESEVYEEKKPAFSIDKVVDVGLSGFFRENKAEIIFDGKYKGKRGRYIAGCVSYSGDFYEPPSEECWFNDLYEELKHKENSLKKNLTVKRIFTGRTIKNEYGVNVHEELPVKKASREQIEKEKNRLERIYCKDIERVKYLRRFK